MKKTRTANTANRAGSRPRRLAWLSVGLVVATLGAGTFDLARERNRSIEAGDAAMHTLARVTDALWLADESRIHALLARLRVELRSGESWAGMGSADDGAVNQSASRRRDTLLRRAIEGAPEVRSIDLVVAGPDGLVSIRVEPEAGPQSAAEADNERGARAKTLWYSDEVQQAVEATGRRVARSAVEISPDDSGARASVRTAIALHDTDEVVQGALVATIDLGPLASRLGTLSVAQTRFALITPEGSRIGESSHAPMGAVDPLLGDAQLANDAVAIVESGGFRSLVQPASEPGDEPADLAFWLERDAPPSLLAAASHSPWLATLAALALLAGALFGWDRDRSTDRSLEGSAPRPRPRSEAGARDESSAAALISGPAASPASDGEIRIHPEYFVLRDWLADVRGCLEREAATRGLTLDLRCERSLPREIQQDPLWLGGLVVSLGRDALDATSASRVSLEVTGEGDSGLRFELDAGDTDLEAVAGMGVIAGRLGATLEAVGRGRLAVVVPATSA